MHSHRIEREFEEDDTPGAIRSQWERPSAPAGRQTTAVVSRGHLPVGRNGFRRPLVVQQQQQEDEGDQKGAPPIVYETDGKPMFEHRKTTTAIKHIPQGTAFKRPPMVTPAAAGVTWTDYIDTILQWAVYCFDANTIQRAYGRGHSGTSAISRSERLELYMIWHHNNMDWAYCANHRILWPVFDSSDTTAFDPDPAHCRLCVRRQNETNNIWAYYSEVLLGKSKQPQDPVAYAYNQARRCSTLTAWKAIWKQAEELRVEWERVFDETSEPVPAPTTLLERGSQDEPPPPRDPSKEIECRAWFEYDMFIYGLNRARRELHVKGTVALPPIDQALDWYNKACRTRYTVFLESDTIGASTNGNLASHAPGMTLCEQHRDVIGDAVMWRPLSHYSSCGICVAKELTDIPVPEAPPLPTDDPVYQQQQDAPRPPFVRRPLQANNRIGLPSAAADPSTLTLEQREALRQQTRRLLSQLDSMDV